MKFHPGDWVLWCGRECIEDHDKPMRIVLGYDINGCVVTVRPPHNDSPQAMMAAIDRFPEDAIDLQQEAQHARLATIESYRTQVRQLWEACNKLEEEAKNVRHREGLLADATKRCRERRDHLVKKLAGAMDDLKALDLEDKEA